MDAAVYEDLSHLERVSSNRFDDNPCFKVDEILRSLQDIDRRVQTRANQLLAERSPSLQRLSSVSAPGEGFFKLSFKRRECLSWFCSFYR